MNNIVEQLKLKVMWIARDLDGALFVYEHEPCTYKSYLMYSVTEGRFKRIPKWMEEAFLKGRKLTWEDKPIEI